MNIQKLRGYWESLPAESPHRGKYAPPDKPNVQPWVALLAVLGGIGVAISGGVLLGLVIAVVGLVWGAFMTGQMRAYEAKLEDYNRATLCLAAYHVF